jgi:hypothetical protein
MADGVNDRRLQGEIGILFQREVRPRENWPFAFGSATVGPR